MSQRVRLAALTGLLGHSGLRFHDFPATAAVSFWLGFLYEKSAGFWDGLKNASRRSSTVRQAGRNSQRPNPPL
jgi:hypothetical protein